MKKRHFILATIILTVVVLNTAFYDLYNKTKHLKNEKILINKTEIPPQQLFNRTALILNHQYLDKTMNNQDWSYWVEHYKDKIKTEDDAYVAIETMVASLNEPFTRFLRKKELKALGESITSNFCGIGINIYNDKDQVVIFNVFKSSPAEIAGLKAKDIILKVSSDVVIISEEIISSSNASDSSFLSFVNLSVKNT